MNTTANNQNMQITKQKPSIIQKNITFAPETDTFAPETDTFAFKNEYAVEMSKSTPESDTFAFKNEYAIEMSKSTPESDTFAFANCLLMVILLFGILSLHRLVNWLIVQFKMMQKAFEDIKRIFKTIDELKCENKVQYHSIKRNEEQILYLVDDVIKDITKDLDEDKADLLQNVEECISRYIREVSLNNSKLSLEIQELRFQLENSQKLIQDFDSKIELRANEFEYGYEVYNLRPELITGNSKFIVLYMNETIHLLNKSNLRKVYEYDLNEKIETSSGPFSINNIQNFSVDEKRLYMSMVHAADSYIVILGLEDGSLIHYFLLKNINLPIISVNESYIFVCSQYPSYVKVFDKVKFNEVATFGNVNQESIDTFTIDKNNIYLVYCPCGSTAIEFIPKMMIYNLDDFTFVKSWEFPIAFKDITSKKTYVPKGIQAQLNGVHLYIPSSKDHQVYVLDKENGEVIKKIGGHWSLNVDYYFKRPQSVISIIEPIGPGKEIIYVFDIEYNSLKKDQRLMIKRVVVD